jgi:hypothetical protein
MTGMMANIFVDIHLSKAKHTVYLDGNCDFHAYTICEYSLRQMLPIMLAAGSTNSLQNTLYDHRG